MWGVDVAVHKTGHHELPVEHRKHGLDGGLWGVGVDMENMAWIQDSGENWHHELSVEHGEYKLMLT